jgi:hypothetical protein
MTAHGRGTALVSGHKGWILVVEPFGLDFAGPPGERKTFHGTRERDLVRVALRLNAPGLPAGSNSSSRSVPTAT